MIERQYIIHNPTGLHARPASQFVRLAASFSSNIQLTCDDKIANAKSIIGVLGLGMSQHKVITLSITGADEDRAMEEIVSFLDNLTN